MSEWLTPAYRGWWSRVWVFRPWRGSRCRSLRTGRWGSGHSGFPPLSPTFQRCCPIPQCYLKHRNDPGKTATGQLRGSKQSYGLIYRSDMKFCLIRLKQVRFHSEATLVKQIVLVGEMKIKINKSSQPKPRLETPSHQRRSVMKLFVPPNH